MSQTFSEIFLVSSCLVGLCTRYDGRVKPSADCLELLSGHHWIPVCPEQLGGLPTPRNPANLIGGDGNDVLSGLATVITQDGRDVTGHFIRGAEQCAAIARKQGIRTAYLKSSSPSCGLHPKKGVTAALLLQHGIKIIEFP